MKTVRLTPDERLEAERLMSASETCKIDRGFYLRFSRPVEGSGCTATPYLVFRYTAPGNKRREMGLGALRRSTVHDVADQIRRARGQILGFREALRRGEDPLAGKRALRDEARARSKAEKEERKVVSATLARVAREYHEKVIEPARSDKHAKQWIQTLETRVPKSVWNSPIARIEAAELLEFLLVLQQKVPETARRVRQRLDAVFDTAILQKLCVINPAKTVTLQLRTARSKRRVKHFAALDYARAPQFFTALQSQDGIARFALEFTLLTAARTAETTGATWQEFDLTQRVWIIPGSRMKAGEPHTVYLPARAVEIVKAMQGLDPVYVFPTPRLNGKPLSNMAMLTLLRRMGWHTETTVHGLRATFSTWSNEAHRARNDVVEACLAHRETNLVRAAYNRAQFAKERRALLSAWAEYLLGQAGAPAHKSTAQSGSYVAPEAAHQQEDDCPSYLALFPADELT